MNEGILTKGSIWPRCEVILFRGKVVAKEKYREWQEDSWERAKGDAWGPYEVLSFDEYSDLVFSGLDDYELYEPFKAYEESEEKKTTEEKETAEKRAKRKTAGPHIEFLGLDVEDEFSILEFISKYGFLGIANPPGVSSPSSYGGVLKRGEESISDIREAHRVYRSIASLWSSIFQYERVEREINLTFSRMAGTRNIQDREGYKKRVQELREEKTAIEGEIHVLLNNLHFPAHLEAITSKASPDHLLRSKTGEIAYIRQSLEYTEDGLILKSLIDRARLTVSSCVNLYLEDVAPAIDDKGKINWRFNTLLSAFYLMLFLDNTKGNHIRQCQYRHCRKFFRSSDPREKYHDPKCENAEAQARYRDRKRGGPTGKRTGRPKKIFPIKKEFIYLCRRL